MVQSWRALDLKRRSILRKSWKCTWMTWNKVFSARMSKPIWADGIRDLKGNKITIFSEHWKATCCNCAYNHISLREDQSSLRQTPIVHWPTQPLKRKSHHHSYLTTTLGQKPWWGFKSKGDWAWVGLVHAALLALSSYMQLLLCLENPAWWCYPQLLTAISFCPTFPWKSLSLGRGACYVSFRTTWGEVGTKSHHELRSYWHLTAARK